MRKTLKTSCFTPVLWLLGSFLPIFGGYTQTPTPTLYGCRPANAVMFFNPECKRVITTEEIRLGQGRVAGFNNEVNPGLDVVIPTNRPDWAIATYHYHALMSNYTGKLVDIHTAMLTSMKETVMTCDPSAAYVYGEDPVNNPWSTRITDLAGNTVTPTINRYPLNTAQAVWQNHDLTIYDGCMQIDPTGIATLRTPPGDMGWRWAKPGTFVDTYHNGAWNPNGSKQSAFLCTKYIGRRNSYTYGVIGKANYDVQTIVRRRAEEGIDLPSLAIAAKDPFAMELVLARSYNQGQWDGIAINMLQDPNFTTVNRVYTQYFADGTPTSATTGYAYWKQIENGFYVLNDKADQAVLPGDNQFYGYYDCMLDWPIIQYYIDLFIKPQTTISPFPNPHGAEPSIPAGTTLPVFYHEVNAAAYEAVVKAAWDQALINSAARRGLPGNVPDGRISFRFDAKPVLDAIVFGLPIDQPNLACATCTGVNTEIIYDKNNLEICPGQFVKLEASPQSSSYTYQWIKDDVPLSSGQGGWNPVYYATTAGIYTLEITDANGCTVKTECMVEVKNKPVCPSCGLTAVSTATNATCTGITDAQITVNLSGGTGNYTYNWSGPTSGSYTTAATSYAITGATEGKYSIEIIDNGQANCSAFADIDVAAAKSIKASATETRAADNCTSTLTANIIDNSVTCRYYVSTSGGFSGNNDVSAKVFSNGALIGSPILGSQNDVAFDIPLGTSIEVKFSVNNSWYFGPSTITLKDNAMAIVGTASESHPGGQVSMEKTVINVTATCALPYSVTYSWSPAAGLASPGSQTTIASPVVNTNYEATIEMTSSPFCKVKTNTVNVRAGCIPLPVDWLYFNAYKFLGDKAILDWGTANEVNVAYFSVERSFDGVQFQSIGVVNATVKGGQNKYQFIDADPLKGHNYYRIRQVDSDGQNHFTDIRFIDFSSSWDVVVYPNSSIDYFTVQLVNAFDMESELSVFNLLGHEIEYHSLNADVHTIAIGSNWEVGVYILKVIQGNEQKIIKLIKEGE